MTESREKQKERKNNPVTDSQRLSTLQLPMNSFLAFLGLNGAIWRIKLSFDLTRLTSGGKAILSHDLTLKTIEYCFWR